MSFWADAIIRDFTEVTFKQKLQREGVSPRPSGGRASSQGNSQCKAIKMIVPSVCEASKEAGEGGLGWRDQGGAEAFNLSIESSIVGF